MRNLLTLILLIGTGYLQAQSKLNIGDEAPAFEKSSQDGLNIKLSEIKSELILLDFWAGWCKPCIKTIKSTLGPINNKYGKEQLQIIGVSYDKSVKKWEKSIMKFEVPWLHIFDADDHDLFKKYSIELIPTYYLIDNKGKIVGSKILSTNLEKTIDNYFQNKN